MISKSIVLQRGVRRCGLKLLEISCEHPDMECKVNCCDFREWTDQVLPHMGAKLNPRRALTESVALQERVHMVAIGSCK